MRVRPFVPLLTVALSLSAGIVQATASQEVGVTPLDALPHASGRLAIRTSGQVAGAQGRGATADLAMRDAVSSVVSASGHALEALDASPRAGWMVATVGLDTSADLERLLDDLAEAGVWASPVWVGSDGGPVWATPTLLVAGDAAQMDMDAIEVLGDLAVSSWGVTVSTDLPHGLAVVESAALLEDQPGVRAAEPDMVFTGAGAMLPNDLLIGDQWPLGEGMGFDIDAPQAWDITTGSADVIIAVIDTGVDPGHPDLNLLPGFDLTSDGPGGAGAPVNGMDRHGTAVAGIASATIGNGLGVAGLAGSSPAVSLRTMISINNFGGWVSQTSWTLAALDAATAVGARVTNNSNAYGFESELIELAYADTRSAGMIHFASAGNASESGPTYPGSLVTVNAVSASTPGAGVASYSNFGPGVFLAAPGSSVPTTDRVGRLGYTSNDYVTQTGTSFASPHAAATAALVLSVNPVLTSAQVEQILAETADPFGLPAKGTGAGHLNAGSAVARAVETLAVLDCPGDINGDGTLTGVDFTDFIIAFNAEGTAADLNGDGVVTGVDFTDFIIAFGAGCGGTSS